MHISLEEGLQAFFVFLGLMSVFCAISFVEVAITWIAKKAGMPAFYPSWSRGETGAANKAQHQQIVLLMLLLIFNITVVHYHEGISAYLTGDLVAWQLEKLAELQP